MQGLVCRVANRSLVQGSWREAGLCVALESVTPPGAEQGLENYSGNIFLSLCLYCFPLAAAGQCFWLSPAALFHFPVLSAFTCHEDLVHQTE